PVIDARARDRFDAYVADFAAREAVIKRLPVPSGGTFVGPAPLRVNGIGDLKEEIFGPILHVATFRAEALDQVIDDINAAGYGLTFGLHTRIDARVEQVTRRIRAGNIY